MKNSTHTSLACLAGGLAAFFWAFVPHSALAQDPYRFNCKDYESTDDRRAPQSAFSYDDTENTFTVEAAGKNNIAFQLAMQKDGAYYIDETKRWFLVKGENLASATSDSYIWWFNGFNNGGQTPPTHSIDGGDGSLLLLWDIEHTPTLNPNMNFTQPPVLIASNGGQMINVLGLTSSGTSSTITDVNYYADFEAAVHYPVLLQVMGFTPATLTERVKTWANEVADKAMQTIEGDAESESKVQVEQAVKDLREACEESIPEGYRAIYSAGMELETLLADYRELVTSYTYERTPNGIHATMNDMHIRLMFYADGLVRVHKSFNKEMIKKSLSVVAEPQIVNFELSENKEESTLTLSSSKVNVIYHLNTSQVEVLRYNGEELLKEKENAFSFFPFRDGPYDSYRISHTFMLDEDENIYGMGQIQDGKLNRRGQTLSLAQNNMKVCIPYFQSSKNYGLFWDNASPTTFTDNADGTRFQSTGTELDYYVICGDKTDEVLAGMRELTGRCPMPALWNFGLYQSKERYTSADETKSVVEEYRKLGVPLDCIVQDWQYWGDNAHWNALEFLNPTFSSHQDMIESIHKNNAKLMISIWANFGPSTRPYAELQAQGRLIPVESYPQNCGVRPYDVYGETARDVYWKYLYEGLVSKGIDAYWMDSTEPDYFNWQPADLDYLTESGATWRSLRNAFPLAHVGGVHDHHRTAEANGDTYLKGKRVSILTRSAFAGQQRYGANTWSGDVTSSWANFAAQIPAACNLSLCGIPYWNSDIGGFFTGGYKGISDPSWRRLYMRWLQFGSFTPMMRFHGTNTPREIYQFGQASDARGDYDHILKYIKIRYRLLPYLYSTAHMVSARHATFMRPLATAFHTDKAGRDVTDEYMFGESFLVAPVVQDAVNSREVYLPEGTSWVDFWTGENLEGGQTLTKTAHTDIMPLYVRAGSILPWGPDVQYSTEKKWDNLEIRVYPGSDGQFVLYEDEGDNYNYEKGLYSEIPFTWNEASQTLTIGARKGQFEGMLDKRTFNIVKVSPEQGTGDAHAARYEATVTYKGEEVSVKLESKYTPIVLVERTSLIENPGFEADGTKLTKTAPKGWTADCQTSWWGVNEGGGKGDPVATEGTYVFGVWDGSPTARAEISQTLNSLPKGNYLLTVDMQASNQNEMVRVGDQRLFANDVQALFRDQVLNPGSDDMAPLQTIRLTFRQDEDFAPVKIGVTTDSAPNQTWFKIDNFRLYELPADDGPVSVAPPTIQPHTRHSAVYTLDGVRYGSLSQAPRGIYVVNGRKVIK